MNLESNNDKLNQYLSFEMTACETYKQATEFVHDDVIRDELQQYESSHRHRVQRLKSFMEENGAQPLEQPGVWNSFATLLAEELFNDKEAVQVLEDEEEKNLRMYVEDQSAHIDGPLKSLLAETLLPEQSEIHEALSILRHSIQ